MSLTLPTSRDYLHSFLQGTLVIPAYLPIMPWYPRLVLMSNLLSLLSPRHSVQVSRPNCPRQFLLRLPSTRSRAPQQPSLLCTTQGRLIPSLQIRPTKLLYQNRRCATSTTTRRSTVSSVSSQLCVVPWCTSDLSTHHVRSL